MKLTGILSFSVLSGFLKRTKMLSMLLFIIAVQLMQVSFAEAQETSTNGQSDQDLAIKVYLDGAMRYEEYIKTEITYVNYVRDRKQAQVYIMLTSQRTGSGGTENTIAFIGQQEFTAVNDTLVYNSNQNDAEETTRRGIVSTMKQGMMRYVSRTPASQYLTINYLKRGEVTEDVVDKWDYWVFNFDTGSRMNGDSVRKNINLDGSLSADRVTPEWKTSLSFSADYNNSNIKVDDYDDNFVVVGEKTVKTYRRSQDFRSLIVKSLTDHWSAGFYGQMESNLFRNIEILGSIAPAIEYNVFPYSESTRREFRFLYKIEYQNVRYNEETMYFKTKEQLLSHNLTATYEIKERWGSVTSTLEGLNYFHDFDKNSLELSSMVSLRLFEGLSLTLSGSVSLIHDQLSLPKRDETEADVLLRRRELETSYDYMASIGIRYSFGSIYSNVVNPRFGGQRRGGGGGGGFGGGGGGFF
ncbi:hypothetical protein ACFL6K_00890 [Candidatus Latescibacterota bacterium]